MESIFQILKDAVRLNASDILITVGVPPRFRSNVELRAVEGA